jgi:hypothetical protein
MKYKYFLFLPGYISIWALYLLPTEWGRKKNVTRGARWFRYKDVLAPILSIPVYLLVAGMALEKLSGPPQPSSNEPVVAQVSAPVISQESKIVTMPDSPRDEKIESVPMAQIESPTAISRDTEPQPSSSSESLLSKTVRSDENSEPRHRSGHMPPDCSMTYSDWRHFVCTDSLVREDFQKILAVVDFSKIPQESQHSSNWISQLEKCSSGKFCVESTMEQWRKVVAPTAAQPN